MLIALLALVSFSVFIQVITVEYLDFQDNNSNIAIPLPLSSPSLIAGFETGAGVTVEKGEIRHGNENVIKIETEHGNQKSTVLEDERLRDLEEILQAARVDITEEERAKIPPKTDVIEMYGSSPVILGLERCEEFRKNVKPEDAFVGPAGMFNTGTNLLTSLLRQNCHIPEKVEMYGKASIGMRGQAPWGKHSPATWRHHHVAMDQSTVNQTNFLPATIVKDPYTWMNSMCRHSYSANWKHNDEHCPNLVPLTELDREGAGGKPSVPVNVRYSDDNITHHESLAGLWNDWYSQWIDATYPRLVIRFEDLLFHAEAVVGQVCVCGGGVMREDFKYIEKSAKEGKVHKGSNGLVKSLVSYGNKTRRVTPYTDSDLEYARKTLNRDAMNMFRYGDPKS